MGLVGKGLPPTSFPIAGIKKKGGPCVQGANYLFSIYMHMLLREQWPRLMAIIQSFIQLSGPTPAAYYYYKGYGQLAALN